MAKPDNQEGRLVKVQQMMADNMTTADIAKVLGISEKGVRYYSTCIRALASSPLIVKNLDKIRQDLDNEILDAMSEAKNEFLRFKQPVVLKELKDVDTGKITQILCLMPKHSVDFHNQWLNSIDKRAKLYGLDKHGIPDSVKKITFQSQTNIGTQTTNVDLTEDKKNQIADILVGDIRKNNSEVLEAEFEDIINE